MHHLDDIQSSKNFTFKCHRDGNDVYAVNSLSFHPVRYFVQISCIHSFLFNLFSFLMASSCAEQCYYLPLLRCITHLLLLGLMEPSIFGTKIVSRGLRYK